MNRRNLLSLVGVGGLVSLSGCLGILGESVTGESTPAPSRMDESQMYEVNESFTAGDMRYTVTEVTVDTRLYVGYTEYATGEGAELVRIRLEMENTTNEEMDIPYTGSGFDAELTFTLVDGQGRRYQVKHSTVSDWEVGPGLREEALFAFEVPDDQESRYLVIQDKVVLIE